MAKIPMSGRKTKGGLEMTSKPLSVAATGVGLVDWLGPGEGDVDGVDDGDALGDGDGEVVAGCSVKDAHGLGGTLAQSLWTPGASPANGLM
jgi:hypothetical protein